MHDTVSHKHQHIVYFKIQIRSFLALISNIILCCLKKDFIYLFIEREGKGGRNKGRETSMCGCLSCAPLLGTWPTTQAGALTGNRTGDPLVCRLAINPLSHTSQGLYELYLESLSYLD